MSSLAACRACLSPNVYLCPAPRAYVDVFRNLTTLVMQAGDGKPQGLCRMCCHYITKFLKFRNRCFEADDILNQMNLSRTGDFPEMDINTSVCSLTPELTCIPVQIEVFPAPMPKPYIDPSVIEVKQEREDASDVDEEIQSEEIQSENNSALHNSHNVEALFQANVKKYTDVSIYPLKCLKVVLHKHNLEHQTQYQEESAKKLDNDTESLPDDRDVQQGRTADDTNKPRCEEVSAKANSLKRKRINHSDKKRLQCQICNKRLSSISNLNIHVRIHKGDKPYQCKVCMKRFQQKCNWTRHQEIHIAEKPYQCDVCEKRFALKLLFNYHVKLHTVGQSYQCEVCEKRFDHKYALNDHLKVHTGEKPYQCKLCKKKFRLNTYLNKHLKVHTGEKPYQCEVCEKRFYQISRLKKHKKMIHSREKLYQCEACTKKFGRKSSLMNHRKVHIRSM